MPPLAKKRGHVMLPRVLPRQRKLNDQRAEELVRRFTDAGFGVFGKSYTDAKATLFLAFDRVVLHKALRGADGSVTGAARALGMPRQSLESILKRRKVRW